MNKKVKEEWKQYLLDENQEYTMDQLSEKFRMAVNYLQSKHIRLNEQMLMNLKVVESQLHLSEQDREQYAAQFQKEGYLPQDSMKMVEVMDALYHLLDISKDEAVQLTLYIAENHLTLAEAIEIKYGFSLDECNDFLEIVLAPYVTYCGKKALQGIRELEAMFSAEFS